MCDKVWSKWYFGNLKLTSRLSFCLPVLVYTKQQKSYWHSQYLQRARNVHISCRRTFWIINILSNGQWGDPPPPPAPALYSCTVLYCAVLCCTVPCRLHRPDSVVVSASAVKQVAAATLRGASTSWSTIDIQWIQRIRGFLNCDIGTGMNTQYSKQVSYECWKHLPALLCFKNMLRIFAK